MGIYFCLLNQNDHSAAAHLKSTMKTATTPTVLAILSATHSHAFTNIIPPSCPLSLQTSRSRTSCTRLPMSSTTDKNQEVNGSAVGAPGTANLPWSELGFEFRPTKSHLRMIYKDGEWGEEELVEVRTISLYFYFC